jgi:hypothetical protein
MKVILKPVQFPDLKLEITVELPHNAKVSDLSIEVYKQFSDIKKNLDFMHRGKKLISDKSLEEQGVKDMTKLMMYQAEGNKVSQNKEDQSLQNKNNAKERLLSMGHKSDVIDSVIKTIPNVELLSSEIIVEKSLIFLNSLKKETVNEYTLEFESGALLRIDEEKLTTIFAIGDGLHGQLGVEKCIKTEFPIRVNKLANMKVKKISCGISHSLALSDNGQGKKKITFNFN